MRTESKTTGAGYDKAQSVDFNQYHEVDGALSPWIVGGTHKNTYQNIPTQLQLSYSQTENMQNIPMTLPGDVDSGIKTAGTSIKSSWLASVEGETFTNVYIGPELAYEELYNKTHTFTITLDLNAYF